jgi:hypothetical protein
MILSKNAENRANWHTTVVPNVAARFICECCAKEKPNTVEAEVFEGGCRDRSQDTLAVTFPVYLYLFCLKRIKS